MTSSCRLLPVLGLVLSGPAWTAPVGAIWNCWYNLDQHVACVLQSSSLAGTLPIDEPRQPDAVAAAKPVRQVASALPTMVQLLRTKPAALRGRTLMIPLHTEPFDHDSVAALAQLVMCGPQLECRARYGERPAVTLESAADFADANDPLTLAGE